MTPQLQQLEELDKNRPIHLSGIGGSAMNGLAMLLTQKGFTIVGTDPAIAPQTRDRLEQEGISVSSIQDGSAIHENTQLVVTSAALPTDHPELRAAHEQRIPVLKYAAMLGVVLNSAKGIAVAGTHGKTSTSAMAVAALRGAGQDPGFVIGGYISDFDAGAYGGKDFMVAEACEYDRSFLNLHPHIALVTNVEPDHLDIYSGLDEIIDSFAEFTQNIPKGGTLIYCRESPAAEQLAQRFKGNRINYGFSNANFTAENLQNKNGRLAFSIHKGSEHIADVQLKLPGHHNVLNALGAFCAGYQLNIDPHGLARGLSSFNGVKRRFELIGDSKGVHVIDDYAHHPTEIRALLQGAKERYPDARILVAFQPHQISRTQFFFDAFAQAFTLADHVFLPDIYAARDTTQPKEITSENLATKMRQNGTNAVYTQNFENTVTSVAETLRPGDIFISVGAGNIYEVAYGVLALLKIHNC